MAQKNDFHYPILVFYAEFDSVNSSYQWESEIFSGTGGIRYVIQAKVVPS